MPRRARIYNHQICNKFSIARFLNIAQIIHFFVMIRCRFMVSFLVFWTFGKVVKSLKIPVGKKV